MPTARDSHVLADRSVIDHLAAEFVHMTGSAPQGLWRAPGRVNLIGDHTDYNGGLALPFAIGKATWAAASVVPGGRVRVRSLDVGSPATADLGEVGSWSRESFEPWSRYPLGTVRALYERGARLAGLELLVSSTVPPGSGLSSSAALAVAVAMAVDDLSGAELSRAELARAAQEAETVFAGTPCGLLDQTAVLAGKAGHGVLIDFSTMATRQINLRTGPLVVVNTWVQHSNADGTYADRLATCRKAAEVLGLATLAEASLEQVEACLEGELQMRARHVVTEDTRVAEVVRRLDQGGSIGDLLVASHRSLRDDYAVSCAELDLAVTTALDHGAAGARLTGGGMGGSIICEGAEAEVLAEPVRRAFARAGFRAPEVYEVVPADGAGRVA